jgi:hypothetical protein
MSAMGRKQTFGWMAATGGKRTLAKCAAMILIMTARRSCAALALLLLSACDDRIDPPVVPPGDWLHEAALKVHREELRPTSGLHKSRFRVLRLDVRDSDCAWVFYDEADVTYTGGDFVYCFDRETHRFKFRLR